MGPKQNLVRYEQLLIDTIGYALTAVFLYLVIGDERL